jgi:transposase
LERTALSKRELRRAEVLARVKSSQLPLSEAAEQMKTSYRHAKRLWKRYEEGGAEALQHGNAGRSSNRARPAKERKKILGLVREKYSGDQDTRFGPTLAAEHLLSEDKLKIHAETLRRWMLSEGLWSRARKHAEHRQRRERKEHFGELVQLDGSFHDWYQGRAPVSCLMNMVDDATSTVEARLGDQETIWAAVAVLRNWIGSYGVPQGLYTDWKNVYVREPTPKELLRGEAPVTQFGRMCHQLGIEIEAANSPQAKGRVERSNSTHQDRLVKKMGRKQIRTHEEANAYLETTYLPEHNTRFAIPPAQAADYHRHAPPRKELEEIFRLETERTVSNDWVVRYENRYFQLQRQSGHYAPAKSKVTVCQWEDGRIAIEYRERKLEYKELDGPPAAVAQPVQAAPRPKVVPKPPGREHPWRQSYAGMTPAGPEGRAKFRRAASATP